MVTSSRCRLKARSDDVSCSVRLHRQTQRRSVSQMLSKPVTVQCGSNLNGVHLTMLGSALLGRENLELLVLR